MTEAKTPKEKSQEKAKESKATITKELKQFCVEITKKPEEMNFRILIDGTIRLAINAWSGMNDTKATLSESMESVLRTAGFANDVVDKFAAPAITMEEIQNIQSKLDDEGVKSAYPEQFAHTLVGMSFMNMMYQEKNLSQVNVALLKSQSKLSNASNYAGAKETLQFSYQSREFIQLWSMRTTWNTFMSSRFAMVPKAQIAWGTNDPYILFYTRMITLINDPVPLLGALNNNYQILEDSVFTDTELSNLYGMTTAVEIQTVLARKDVRHAKGNSNPKRVNPDGSGKGTKRQKGVQFQKGTGEKPADKTDKPPSAKGSNHLSSLNKEQKEEVYAFLGEQLGGNNNTNNQSEIDRQYAQSNFKGSRKNFKPNFHK